MKRASRAVSVFIFCVSLAGRTYAQTGNAQLSGIVEDISKALMPGVTITAINVDTNVTLTQITNETGAYSFPVLQPGTYRVSAELPGFKKAVNNDVRLPYAGQVRINFTMEVGTAQQSIEVTVGADSIMRESSASVGNVLNQDSVLGLPLVGNNVLDLLNTMPGINLDARGEIYNTINGLGINSINPTRDGLSIVNGRIAPQDALYSAGYKAFSPTTLVPDLVGEIRVITSPVDAELGRGNTQIQIRTRSGTNQYNGSATWNIRNTALDANTWMNNHTLIDGKATPLDWQNNHQYTVAYGGPIQIPGVYNGKNKTFFYTLWEQNIHNARDTTTVNVLSDTARLGIYRYFTGYNPVGFNPNASVLNATPPLTATSASRVAVDTAGNPLPPPFNPDGSPYTGQLVCFSVFGNRRLDTNGNMVPFTQADCPWGTAVLGQSNGNIWDPKRPSFDASGYIKKILDLTPRANYFGGGDGLNIAQYRFQRRRKGGNSTAAIIGGDLYSNNKQYNLKIDHNFNANHKVAVSYSYQRDDSADNVAQYPGGVSGWVFRRPHVLTANFTSTLSPRIINEARFGLNHEYNYDVPAWFNPDPATRQRAEELLMRGSPSTLNPDYTYLTVVRPACCGMGGTIESSNGYMATSAFTTNVLAFNDLWNYADTLSWSKGKHTFKFGGELRLPRTTGNGGLQPYPTITLGNNTSATATASPFGTVSNFSADLPGLLNSAPPLSGVTAARTNVTNLLYYLSGSVSSASNSYWINNFTNVNNGVWSDYSTSGDRKRKQILQEWAAFVKDDYKITRRLTLNLGVRWEFAASPYIDGGFTAAVLGYGYGAFGATRTAQSTLDQFNKDPFSLFMRPGNLYLTGYGSSATNPLSCQLGVQQNPLLPVSTCDPKVMSSIQFVGPGSPNPGITAEPVNYYNLGPAIGFAYQLPWFGEGKTTIRAGYQQTFGAAGVNRGALGGTEAEIANAPGATLTASTVVTDSVFQNILATRALTLSDIQSLVPVRPAITPGGTVPIYGRSAGPTVYDPHFKTPYTQNVTFSITRQLPRNMTLDVRYIGTFGRKQQGTLDLNTPNIYHNPELFQALTDARAGKCTPSGYPSYTAKGIDPCDVAGDPVILDQLLAGLNINNTVAGFGPVGTVNSNGVFQSGAQQLRRSSALAPNFFSVQSNLAWGDFNSVAGALVGLAPTAAQGRQAAPINPSTGAPITGISMIALRNGCDRIANGFTIVQQTTASGSQVANTGAPIPLRCFPEDWLIANPQFSSINYTTNLGHNNYNSLQVGLTARPINGITTQANWVWAKSMQLPTSGYFDPANRNLNFGVQNINAHSLRMNGIIELPIGPNKLFFGNSSGWVARILEKWQTGFIANLASGTPANFTPAISHFYASSRYNVQPGWKTPHGKVQWVGDNGYFYGNPSPYMGVTDPQCLDPNIVTQGDKMGTNLSGVANSNGAAVCTIFALAKRNPDGTQGDYLLTYPMPGQVGNSGNGNILYFGQWSLDMNFSKMFKISESRSFQLRVDATNILNHPVPNRPNLGASNLGQITGKSPSTNIFDASQNNVTPARQLQAQLRINF